jgi:hypothetical protein
MQLCKYQVLSTSISDIWQISHAEHCSELIVLAAYWDINNTAHITVPYDFENYT